MFLVTINKMVRCYSLLILPMILPLLLSSQFFNSPYNGAHVTGLFSPCATSIFKNSPYLHETEPNCMDIKKESKNLIGGESKCKVVLDLHG